MKSASAEILVPMTGDVDGAPNAYGPDDKKALDFELNAHRGAKPSGAIVGYRTKDDDGETPIVQGPGDPCPGFFVAETSYHDIKNNNLDDPRRYVNAAEINYTLFATAAANAGVKLGDFCTVHSLRTRLTVYAIVGDSGHSSGAEGSLALLQRLGYPFKDGKNDSVEKKEIVVRYFARTNSDKRFFLNQAELDTAARELDLDTDFSDRHPGDPGTLVLAAVGITGSEISVERVQPFAPLNKTQAEDPPIYPGHLLERDSDDVENVRVVQKRLRDLGFTEPGPDGTPLPLKVDGGFGTNTFDAVELFQMRHTDLNGRPLVVDGQVGSTTWAALFGRDSVHVSPETADDKLLARVLEIAATQVGVLEDPLGSNSGEQVDAYLDAVGLEGGNFWCAAFVYWCFREAAKDLKISNPAIRTAGVLDHWNRAREKGVATVTKEQAFDDPSKIKPGFIFIMSTGGGNGHTGLVVRVSGGVLETIEGNTNDGGSRNGIGVFRRNGRTVASINRGFINYGS